MSDTKTGGSSHGYDKDPVHNDHGSSEDSGPPPEGSNRGEGPEGQKRSNISDTVSTGAADVGDSKLAAADEDIAEDG